MIFSHQDDRDQRESLLNLKDILFILFTPSSITSTQTPNFHSNLLFSLSRCHTGLVFDLSASSPSIFSPPNSPTMHHVLEILWRGIASHHFHPQKVQRKVFLNPFYFWTNSHSYSCSFNILYQVRRTIASTRVILKHSWIIEGIVLWRNAILNQSTDFKSVRSLKCDYEVGKRDIFWLWVWRFSNLGLPGR